MITQTTPETLPPVLLRYQQELLASTSLYRVTVVEKSRRTGYSWAIASDAVLVAASEAAAGGMDVFYMGYNLEMGREFIDYCADWAKHFGHAAAAVEEYIWVDPDEPDKSVQAFRIRFASGHKIVVLPSVPRALRGMQGYVIIDEAAFHDDLDELLKAAFALLIWGGKVCIISTHDGQANPFNKLVEEQRARPRKGYNLLRCTFDDALADGLYKRICLKTKQQWTPEAEAAWRAEIIETYGEGAEEELFCVPSQTAGAYISFDLIERACEADIPILRFTGDAEFNAMAEADRASFIKGWLKRHLTPLLPLLNPDLQSVLGKDIARRGDLSVIWPAQIGPNLIRRPPFIIEMRNMPFAQQKQVLFAVIEALPRLVGVAIDATGIGAMLAEAAADKFGSVVRQVTLTEAFYREHMPPFKAAFEDSKTILPQDAEVVADHHAIKLKSGAAHIMRDGKAKRHGDSAVAHFLSYTASRLPVMEYGYTPASAAGSNDNDDDDDKRGGFAAGAY